ncbi:hypothetical protein [Pseudoxanthomonas suwonensis]|uniref:DUF3619 family protein n=1 Tax=Pseudoxanthomonas suwonensis TaxID=314722 RepID=A0A0E3UM59_9GAMM|nr:hypothetical protein [Pseudoxanthomonas suwonensis]AKC86051.1 hypothetical protein WQ53_03965 [Pseudoxanthomonas suwonensis]
MTTAPDPVDFDPIDSRARQLHAAALADVSAPTLARLRQARRAAADAAPRRRPLFAPWLAGGAVAAAVALAVLLHPGVPTPGAPDQPALAAATADPAEPLQEDPGFYLWLDSADAIALAME